MFSGLIEHATRGTPFQMAFVLEAKGTSEGFCRLQGAIDLMCYNQQNVAMKGFEVVGLDEVQCCLMQLMQS
jgi:hypothetical protein